VKLAIRDARAEDGEALAGLLGQLGYPATADAVSIRIDRLAASGDDRLVVARQTGRSSGSPRCTSASRSSTTSP